MTDRVPKHERVRFRRRDIRKLHKMPSAHGSVLHPAVHATRRGWPFKLAVLLATVVMIAALALGTAFIALKSGMNSEQLTARAREALQKMAGEDIVASLDSARLGLDPQSLIMVEANRIRFNNRDLGSEIGTVDAVRLGLAPAALLAGRLEVSSITIDGVHIASAAPSSEGAALPPAITGPAGQIDPDRVYETFFDGVERLLSAFDKQVTRRVRVTNIRLPEHPAFGDAGARIVEIGILRDGSSLALDGRVSISGRDARLGGVVERLADGGLSLDIEIHDAQLAMPPIRLDRNSDELLLPHSATAALRLSGRKTGQEGQSLQTSLLLEADGDEDGATRELLRAKLEIAPGTGKVEIAQLRVSLGANVFDLEGAIGPQPEPVPDNAYRFNLVSKAMRLAPSGSPEPPIQAGFRIAGSLDATGRNIVADDLVVRTNGGEIIGQAHAYFPTGKSPAVFLAIRVPKLPVAHAKQIWPEFAATKARSWVMDNVFGGMVRNSSLEMSVGPGRFGPGVHLSGEEISGHFEVEDTRFDVAGDIPPVRDAYGTVDFRGSDVDITLKSGIAYLESGRTVSASNGALTIRQAHMAPVIADLDIDVAGDADAVAELSGFHPINALRYIDIVPDDLSGSVTGHVTAEIPLSRQRPDRKLGWSVGLDFTGLSLAREFDGQSVENADGRIELVPQMAVIKATADLNGLPAVIEIEEPLGDEPGEGSREIAFVFDRKTDNTAASGLGEIVSGPVKVQYGGKSGEKRHITADLTDAVIELPWIGWSKGRGIEAQARFVLEKKDTRTEISDFVLEGPSFGLLAGFVLEKGQISQAAFTDVRLNRDDLFDVTMKKNTNGYDIAFSGKSIDLRPIIKKYRPAASGGSGLGSNMAVNLKAKVATVHGFNGRKHKDLNLELRSDGKQITAIDAQITTGTGSPVTVEYGTKANSRTVSVSTSDAGAVLNFLDIYKRVSGGTAEIMLAGNSGGPLIGTVDLRDFFVINEPNLSTLAQARAPNGHGRSLNEVLPAQIDTGRVKFDRGYAFVEKGDDYLNVSRGILAGPTVGTTFEGAIFDGDGGMALNGTFMPAYGINSALSNIPVLGYVLGNGRERGLIGVTYRVVGDPKAPTVQINPLSIIAPGIFRSIFEFR